MVLVWTGFRLRLRSHVKNPSLPVVTKIPDTLGAATGRSQRRLLGKLSLGIDGQAASGEAEEALRVGSDNRK